MAAVAAAAAVVFVVTRPLQAAVEKEKRKVPTSEFTHSLICFHPFIHCTLQCFAAPSFTSCAADSVTTAAAGSVGSGGSWRCSAQRYWRAQAGGSNVAIGKRCGGGHVDALVWWMAAVLSQTSAVGFWYWAVQLRNKLKAAVVANLQQQQQQQQL
jgi:hypothetical protein